MSEPGEQAVGAAAGGAARSADAAAPAASAHAGRTPADAETLALDFCAHRLADWRLRFLAGQTGRLWGAPLRALLALVARGVAWFVRRRNRRFDREARPAFRAPVPVISVGNLTVGGTGKTPMVGFVLERLLLFGRRPAVLSRGYGARAIGSGSALNDEARELAGRFPDVPHVQDPDRARAARALLGDVPDGPSVGSSVGEARGSSLGDALPGARAVADVLVLDDGFSHRQVRRDLDLVLIDATLPFGLGRLLPRGLLREPLDALSRAACVIITRTDRVPVATVAAIEARLALWLAPGTRVLRAVHRPYCLRPLGPRSLSVTEEPALAAGPTEPEPARRRRTPDWLAGRSVLGFAGVGNPGAVAAMLRALGADLLGFTAFADHHAYRARELAALAAQAQALGAQMLVTTAKDAVKVAPLLTQASLPVYALDVRLALVSGGECYRDAPAAAAAAAAAVAAFDALLRQALGGEAPAPS